MLSRKKRNRLKCHKCIVPLTKWNWDNCDKKKRHHICKGCRKRQDCRRHSSDPKFKKGQLDRYYQRRSAVIFSYGNECCKCQEDNYNKLTICKTNGGRVDINFLYDNSVNKLSYQVICYNCRHTRANEDPNKKAVITHYGGYCSVCQEDRLEKLTLNVSTNAKLFRQFIKNGFSNLDIHVLCFNCNHDRIALQKYPPETEKQPG